MNRVFADSSAIIAYFCKRDEKHHKAAAGIKRLRDEDRRMILTDYVFDECITGIMSSAGHAQASMAGQFILGSSIISVVWLDQDIKLRAWEYFVRHDDKGYSFTDCTSFVVMKEMKLTHCLAFDKHFEQAGFHLIS
jgi:predicted nucleic acid-binding protein